ncbi:PREDICTED: LOW QUALITY PROTEIN: estradiol 17-beta-dehydrogenase 8-like [Ceratosolen solmsi marchali]|uniref:LOW QUALITY PROTEIN: estradiol 17-beta-dehydrogenase 8-like n=1 Tax=Ceratosolen solmsi marchali TaxID=326594 RepID=A0AAJ6YXY2_9HYME|nr:PREDICTED: LOW QUALITY PROTEIN: estradiol 17-beta-dehydrogenase 8-like [Ceratosolen solmsi marchali]
MTTGLLSEKLALVTGAGSGIGRKVCSLLAKEGAKVLATDQNVKAVEDTVAELQGTGHIPIKLNVKNVNDIEDLFTNIKRNFSIPTTIIVNNAGIVRSNSIVDMSEKDFNDVIDVNLKGAFFIMQYAARAIINAGNTDDASIINISSIASIIKYPYNANYTASKAGMNGLIKTAAAEFLKYDTNIDLFFLKQTFIINFIINPMMQLILGMARVNAILPGLVNTPLSQTLHKETIQELTENKIFKYTGKTNDVAELVTFLASPKSLFINGALIEITGGYI